MVTTEENRSCKKVARNRQRGKLYRFVVVTIIFYFLLTYIV
jgi:hypothetical protein